MSDFVHRFTCRLCHQSALRAEVVKYARRHYAHPACYVEAKKPLRALDIAQLATFPPELLAQTDLGDEIKSVLARWRR